MGYSPWGHKELDMTEPLSSKAMVFPVVMYVCESWTVKKAERRRIGAFELWCWRRLLRVPWISSLWSAMEYPVVSFEMGLWVWLGETSTIKRESLGLQGDLASPS